MASPFIYEKEKFKMITKTITYTDFDGNEQTESFMFNLTKAELYEMQMGIQGGLNAFLDKVREENNFPEMINFFKTMITKSFGRLSEDRKRFIKSDAMTEEFTQTAAYSEIYMELAGNPESAEAFMLGIMPAGMQEQITQMMVKQNTETTTDATPVSDNNSTTETQS